MATNDTTAPNDPTQKARFELIIGDDNGTITSGDVKVRWCVTPTLIKNMEDQGIVDPHVLVATITSTGHEMDRKLVPLTDLMTFARFHRSGKDSVIHAWIVNGASGRKKLQKILMAKTDRQYNTTLFYGAEVLVDKYDVDILFHHASYVLDIPSGVFGKEPAPWLKWYINLWHDNKRVEDQCAFRKRALLSIPKLIPFIFLSGLLMLLHILFAVAVAGAGFRRNLDISHIFRIWDDPACSLMLISGPYKSRWDQDYIVNRRTGGGPIQHHVMFLPFTPLIFAAGMFLVTAITMSNWGDDFLVEYAFINMGRLLLVVVPFVLVIDAIVAFALWAATTPLWTKLSARWVTADEYMIEHNYWPATIAVLAVLAGVVIIGLVTLGFIMFHWLITTMILIIAVTSIMTYFLMIMLERNAIEHNDYTEIRELLCPSDPLNLSAKYEDVINEHQTLRTRVHLRFLRLKNDVCKPMQL